MCITFRKLFLILFILYFLPFGLSVPAADGPDAPAADVSAVPATEETNYEVIKLDGLPLWSYNPSVQELEIPVSLNNEDTMIAASSAGFFEDFYNNAHHANGEVSDSRPIVNNIPASLYCQTTGASPTKVEVLTLATFLFKQDKLCCVNTGNPLCTEMASLPHAGTSVCGDHFHACIYCQWVGWLLLAIHEMCAAGDRAGGYVRLGEAGINVNAYSK